MQGNFKYKQMLMSDTFNKRGRQKVNITFYSSRWSHSSFTHWRFPDRWWSACVAAGPQLIFNLTFVLISV